MKEYKLVQITDILDVPEKHIVELLRDLGDYYALFRPLKKLGRPVNVLVFKPDGKRSHKVKVIPVKPNRAKENK